MATATFLSVLGWRLCLPLWCLPSALPPLSPQGPGQMFTLAPHPGQGLQDIIHESPEPLGPSMSQELHVISFHPGQQPVFLKYDPCFSAFSNFSSVNTYSFCNLKYVFAIKTK